MRREKISVLLVDDHAVVRQGVRAFLQVQADIDVVAEANNGKTAVLQAIEHAPDVVLMDLLMPDIDGVEATRQLKKVSPRTQIIILTSYHQDEHIFPAIRAGALSYLLKDVEPTDLVNAVRRAALGEAILNPKVAARVIQAYQSPTAQKPNVFTELSAREMEVLRLLADGLNNATIATTLIISEKTVKSHVSNILSKLHLGDRTQAAVYAWREGVVRRHE